MFQKNHIQLTGNVTKEPETRQAGETTVTSARLMHNMKLPKGDGEFVERIAAIDVEIWGKRGEAFAKHINPKVPVFVEGMLMLDQWEYEGNPRSRLFIRVNDWQFLAAPAEDSKPDAKPDAKPKRGAKTGATSKAAA